MFKRSETATVRTLLRLVESQQRMIAELVSQVMHLTGRTWMPPPLQPEQPDEEEEPAYAYSAFDGLPPTEDWDGTEPDR